MPLLSLQPLGGRRLQAGRGAVRTIRGELAVRRDPRAATLYSVDPPGIRTMKQRMRLAAKLRGGGPILPAASRAIAVFGVPPLGSSSAARRGGERRRPNSPVLAARAEQT